MPTETGLDTPSSYVEAGITKATIGRIWAKLPNLPESAGVSPASDGCLEWWSNAALRAPPPRCPLSGLFRPRSKPQEPLNLRTRGAGGLDASNRNSCNALPKQTPSVVFGFWRDWPTGGDTTTIRNVSLSASFL
jgi:hypothetical protein